MEAGQLPPNLLLRATDYRIRGRVHFQKDAIGEIYPGEEDDFVVFRKMVLDPAAGQPEEPGAIFTVRFYFARFSPKVNKRLSALPAPFIAAQPGFRSKIWMLGRSTHMFQGVYEWDEVTDAEAYWSSFPMRMMKRRAVPSSMVHDIEPT